MALVCTVWRDVHGSSPLSYSLTLLLLCTVPLNFTRIKQVREVLFTAAGVRQQRFRAEGILVPLPLPVSHIIQEPSLEMIIAEPKVKCIPKFISFRFEKISVLLIIFIIMAFVVLFYVLFAFGVYSRI